MTEKTPCSPLHLFQGFGIELEYMIVNRSDLSVLPIADQLILAESGRIEGEIERGCFRWSNELALHVIEVKSNGPAPTLEGLGQGFHEQVRHINRLLGPLEGRLLPSSMHPTMDPHRETKLWPHEQSAIYSAYDRIFGCQGHGWSNLQSMHINLPFADDEEFAKLHAAIRIVLPLLPGLAASSPVVEGRLTGSVDSRLVVYSQNQKKFKTIIGSVIPEAVLTRSEYETRVLEPMYREIASVDPEGILQGEWLNSRGAISRFERNAIEIRVLDIQENPNADIAIAWMTCQVIRLLTKERWATIHQLNAMDTGRLATIFFEAIHHGEQTVIEDRDVLDAFGYSKQRASISEIWQHLFGCVSASSELQTEAMLPTLREILDRGPLARRIIHALGKDPSKSRISEVYQRLAECLDGGVLFV